MPEKWPTGHRLLHGNKAAALRCCNLRRATHPDPRKRASWGATNLCDGRFVQHFPITAQTWTSGSGYPNNNFFCFENEGVAGEPLTQPQIDNIIRVGRELSALQGWKATRPTDADDTTASCYEHTECVRFGSAATSCPSGRIPWNIIIPAINEEDDVAERVWCSDRLQTWIIGKFGAAPVLTPDMDAPFVALYGPHTRALTGAQLDAMKPK